jgi:hypothetical protein
MTAGEMGAVQVRRLLAEVRGDRRALVDRCSDVSTFAAPSASPSPERSQALALALDRTYTALESILERVARTLEAGLPVGEDWHRALLQGAALEIDQVRPAILGAQAIVAADRLRRFRHFLRHAYSAAIDPVQVAAVAAAWLGDLPMVAADLDRFEEFLERLAGRLVTG